MQFNETGTQLAQIANEAKAAGLSDQETAEVLQQYSQTAQDESESED